MRNCSPAYEAMSLQLLPMRNPAKPKAGDINKRQETERREMKHESSRSEGCNKAKAYKTKN